MPITDSEKARRSALLEAHYDVENSHDIDGIMATFSPDCEVLYTRIPFTDPQSIRYAHSSIGFSDAGAFEGIEATSRNVELPFVAFYHFDKTDKLISERVVMNLGVLVASA